MGGRREAALFKKAEPLMAPGERPELGMVAKLNDISTASKAAIAAVGSAAMVLAGAAGGFVGVSTRPRYLVLTDRQLLVFDVAPVTNGPGRHLASIPRELITAAAVRRSGLVRKLRLEVQGRNRALDLTFPPLPPSNQRKIHALAAALTPATTQVA
jgi:hypothetical protein